MKMLEKPPKSFGKFESWALALNFFATALVMAGVLTDAERLRVHERLHKRVTKEREEKSK